jgi:prevent-host-death family protein
LCFYKKHVARTIRYSEARQRFSTTMNSAINDGEPVLITRQRGGNYVLIAQKDFEAMEETALSSAFAGQCHAPAPVHRAHRKGWKFHRPAYRGSGGDANPV